MTDELEGPGKDLNDEDGFEKFFSGVILETFFPY
jgi:hypothetical protein